MEERRRGFLKINGAAPAAGGIGLRSASVQARLWKIQNAKMYDRIRPCCAAGHLVASVRSG
ncbi:MAG: hypothetical protein A4E66_01185 [Syntrophus sp. PtaB.Bin001]|nr:MAG: hypothetical protein A4E66_01185 [Syntrophus sp. PtaB.Bin001]